MLNKIFLILSILFSLNANADVLSAKLNWLKQSQYSFTVDGVVDKVFVSSGDEVAKGDLLAQLEQLPFEYAIQRAEANLKQLKPQVLDAKLELERAHELLERASLSEIQLQKIDTLYQVLKSKENSAIADLNLAKWQQQKSILRAAQALVISSSNIQRGAQASVYNRSQFYIKTASLNMMLATADIKVEDAMKLNKKLNFVVIIKSKKYAANWYDLSQHESNSSLYRLQVKFKYAQDTRLLAGMAAEISY